MSLRLYLRLARALALLFAGAGCVASVHGAVDSSILTGKVMVGYQGSFNAQGPERRESPVANN